MSTNFPSALDTFTNPNGSDSLNAAAVPHAEQHANANDAIEALQAKVGINGSAVQEMKYHVRTDEITKHTDVQQGIRQITGAK